MTGDGQRVGRLVHGDHVASIERGGRGSRLTYTDKALRRYPLGTPLLTLSLSGAERAYPQRCCDRSSRACLPEGGARRAIAREVGKSPSDTYGLIRALGWDCAGAVVIQAGGRSASLSPTTATAEPLTSEEIESLVRQICGAPLGAGARVRSSLAGLQEKLVLSRMPDGQWATHQEDFCQAIGIPPETKYGEDGGPSLSRIAGLLATVATSGLLECPLGAVVVNSLLGNGDAHAKNFWLLHEASGTLRLSPLYDLLSTLHYGDDHLAMHEDGVHCTTRVRSDRFLAEARKWGWVELPRPM